MKKLSIILAYLSLYLFQGENVILTIHDNLDSEFIYRTLLAKTNTMFSWSNETTLPQVMNGLPRNALNANALNVTTWFFALFPPIWAYLLHFTCVKLIAFFGMNRLAKALWKDISPQNAGWLALGFALLPQYTMYGLSVCGLPLLCYAYLQIQEGERTGYFFVALFPFWSQFVLVGFVILGIIAFFIVYEGLFKQQGLFSKPFEYWKINFADRKVELRIFGLLLIGYAFSELNLWMLMFVSSDFISHRTLWDLSFNHHGFMQAVKESVLIFLFGIYHAPTMPLVMWGAVLGLFVFSVYRRVKTSANDHWEGHQQRSNLKPTALFHAIASLPSVIRSDSYLFLIFTRITLIILISIIGGFWFWEAFIPLKNGFSLLKSFNVSRVTFLLPLLWYILFGYTIQHFQHRKMWATGFLILNALAIMITNTELRANVLQVCGISQAQPNFKTFFAPELFSQIRQEIRQEIGEDPTQYRVASVGLHPSIAQFNGFYTLDSYQNNYSATYKAQFRRIIAPELAKSKKWRDYFDKWGNRCYILAKDLEKRENPFLIAKDLKTNAAISLNLDAKAFQEMGGKFIFSTVPISNFEGFRLWKRYDGGMYRIWVYEVMF